MADDEFVRAEAADTARRVGAEIDRALSNLGPSDRAFLWACVEKADSMKVIPEGFGLTPAAAYSREYRLLRRLEHALRAGGIQDDDDVRDVLAAVEDQASSLDWATRSLLDEGRPDPIRSGPRGRMTSGGGSDSISRTVVRRLEHSRSEDHITGTGAHSAASFSRRPRRGHRACWGLRPRRP